MEDKRAGEDAGRGSGTESDSDAIPLESDDTELNRELDEINSLGVSKEAEYTQAVSYTHLSILMSSMSYLIPSILQNICSSSGRK